MIPMAISLAWGVLFATFIALILVPVNTLILEDIKRALQAYWHWQTGTTDKPRATEPTGLKQPGAATVERVVET